MRLMLVTLGSRGDVDPFVALARTASTRGHDVRLGVSGSYVADLADEPYEALALDGDYAGLVQAQGVSSVRGVRSFKRFTRPLRSGSLRSVAKATVSWQPDIVVHHPKALSAPLAAAALDVPHVLVEIIPTRTPTRAHPAADAASRDLGPFNILTIKAIVGATELLRSTLVDLRRDLGLPAFGRLSRRTATLCPISPALLPRPDDWPETTYLTGHWVSAYQPQLSPKIAEFLGHRGDSRSVGDVIYVGFGSMAGGDAVRRTREVVDGIRAVGKRALLGIGWGGLDPDAVPPADDVMILCEVPFASVFPRTAAAIHHGGSGTVHYAARAGTVSVVVPFIADQPWWGALLHRRGLAPPPLPWKRVTADAIAERLASIDEYRASARSVASQMQNEHGTEVAVDILETLV